MRQAKNGGVDIVHFSECALSGYAGIDFESFEGYDWDFLRAETKKVMALAGEHERLPQADHAGAADCDGLLSFGHVRTGIARRQAPV